MISPSADLISSSTALSRSSNSPRYLAPATMAPRSRAMIRLDFRPSGTSPSAMRRARPSTIAVLPTPGSPINTGLFLVRRESTWITRRISSSRPMTGSRLPLRASAMRSRPYCSRAFSVASGSSVVTLRLPLRACKASRIAVGSSPCRAKRVPGRARVFGDREKQMLHRQVVVPKGLTVAVRCGEHLVQIRRCCRLAPPVDIRLTVEDLLESASQIHGPSFEAVEDRIDDALLLAEQGKCEVGRLDRTVVMVSRRLSGIDEGVATLGGELLGIHLNVSVKALGGRSGTTVVLGHSWDPCSTS